MRGERHWRDVFHPILERRIERVARRVKPSIILAVYPMLHFFAASVRAAEVCRIPYVAYLHDTLAEQYRNTKYDAMAEGLQHRMFSSANAVLVTSRAMSDLYRSRYGADCFPLEIGYREPIAATPPPTPAGSPYAFMGGSIYAVNHKSVLRLMEGTQRAGFGFRLATPANWVSLERYGILPREGIEKVHYNVRLDYLNALRLASGQPILVHCPENYFLARFIREQECGIVVSVREAAAIEVAARGLLEGGLEHERMRRNALRAASLFSMNRVARCLRQTLNQAVFSRQSNILANENRNGLR